MAADDGPRIAAITVPATVEKEEEEEEEEEDTTEEETQRAE